MLNKLLRRFWIIINQIRFKIHGFKFGTNLLVFNKLYLKVKGQAIVTIGDNFAFSSGSGRNPLSRNIKGAIELENNAELIIGNNVGISSSCLWVFEKLEIGSQTKIGADSIILDSDTHSLDFIQRSNYKTDRVNAKKKGIKIGNDVLVGTRCIILKGVSIGDRSIIGSGSIVTKDIPSDCIAAGNPAKIIKTINTRISE